MNCTILERLSTYLTVNQIIVAIVLSILIFFVIVGNTLVILSVVIYKRMRTFTNKLSTSLAIADLLVGLFVMPLSLLDLLLNHAWPFDKLLCKVWSTSDVLFCTASILNLCIISIDRYFAISKPLQYLRTRNRKTAALLLGTVWLVSFIVCTPPWIFHLDDYPVTTIYMNASESTSCSNMFVCSYPGGVLYRIYSSMASFFIPLLLMCFVYYKIFRIVSTREKVLWKSVNLQSYESSYRDRPVSNRNKERCDNERYHLQANGMLCSEEESISGKQGTDDLMYSTLNIGISALKSNSSTSEMTAYDRSKPRRLLAKAHDRYQIYGPKKFNSNTRKKIIYMKERKALKTIAILVLAFSICWLPFFVIYLIEVLISSSNDLIYATQEVFLWLGYSNSVLNPIIYTMYNHDFRRCFRDLLTLGFMRKQRSMSIRKLYQYSTC